MVYLNLTDPRPLDDAWSWSNNDGMQNKRTPPLHLPAPQPNTLPPSPKRRTESLKNTFYRFLLFIIHALGDRGLPPCEQSSDGDSSPLKLRAKHVLSVRLLAAEAVCDTNHTCYRG